MCTCEEQYGTENEKTSRYLLRDWKPENPAFGKIKENILHEETSGYQSVVYSCLLCLDAI